MSSKRHFPQVFWEDALLPEIFALKRASSLPSEATRERDSFYPSTSGSNPLWSKPWSHNGCRSSWHWKNRYCSAGGKWSECWQRVVLVKWMASNQESMFSPRDTWGGELAFPQFPRSEDRFGCTFQPSSQRSFWENSRSGHSRKISSQIGPWYWGQGKGGLLVSGTVTNIITSMFLKQVLKSFLTFWKENGCMCPP